MKILITGVAGFIGSNLVLRLLDENRKTENGKRKPGFVDRKTKTGNRESEIGDKYEVIGVDNLSFGLKENIPEGVEFYEADIRSKDIYPIFKGVDYVFHLAAKNCISDCQEDPVETAYINVTGAVNVFEAAKIARVTKVVYAESSALYEGSSKFPSSESEIKPESFYAVSKLASMYFARAYQTYSDLKFTSLRYFCVYGPAQDYRRTIPPVMSAFIIKLLRNERPIIYGTGKKRRDFVYIDDVNDFHMKCINDPRTDNKTFNLGAGKNYSVLEIYKIISELLGKKIEPIFKPDLPGEAEVTLADITEARKLGWEPKKDIKTGILKAIEYIKSEIAGGRI